jgi:FdrA protein
MSAISNAVRKGFYLDSVALMRLSRTIAAMPGVAEAALMMGSASNKQILRDAKLLGTVGEAAHANDLIVAVRAKSGAAARVAVDDALQQLDAPRPSGRDAAMRKPRTLRAALGLLPGANLALISVPGEFAIAEARKAIRNGLHAMIFSDNVPLDDERVLKQEACALGRLVMGPDCGTALINGVPLAFANRVPRGDIAIIGASGTGMQEIMCLIARGGKGISHAIGVGGRDLGAQVGGLSTLMAIDALDADPTTRHIVIVSKPPHAGVAAEVLARVAASKKRFTICFIGGEAVTVPVNAALARTLEAAAQDALGAPVGVTPMLVDDRVRRRPGTIRGLFCGGTLCAEAQVVLAGKDRHVASNTPVPGSTRLDDADERHDRLLDLGGDEYTRGRPHPMIDPSVRDDALRDALNDPTVGAILIDVVLGHGAHPNPAGRLADVLAAHGAGGAAVVASVTGTEDDPQCRSSQLAQLAQAGVLVAASNAQAAELALALCRV